MRKFFLFIAALCCATTILADETSGSCGENLSWTYDSYSQKLTISGSGDMTDFEPGSAPWYTYHAAIEIIYLYHQNIDEYNSNPAYIGNNAFKDFSALTDIYCPPFPPRLGNNVFDAYSGTKPQLHMLANCEPLYQNAQGWNDFDIVPPMYYDEWTKYLAESGLIYSWHFIMGEINGVVYAGHSSNFDDHEIHMGVYSADASSTGNNIAIPETITCGGTNLEIQEIFQNAFLNSSMTSIELPSSLWRIYESSFHGCSSLQRIVCHATIPPVFYISVGMNSWDEMSEATSEVFSGVRYDIPVFVPDEAIENYRAADSWGNYFTNILPLSQKQDIDQISNEQSTMSNKTIKDGVLLILRGDKTYTLTGQEVQ